LYDEAGFLGNWINCIELVFDSFEVFILAFVCIYAPSEPLIPTNEQDIIDVTPSSKNTFQSVASKLPADFLVFIGCNEILFTTSLLVMNHFEDVVLIFYEELHLCSPN
jgi:hypothetical protein